MVKSIKIVFLQLLAIPALRRDGDDGGGTSPGRQTSTFFTLRSARIIHFPPKTCPTLNLLRSIHPSIHRRKREAKKGSNSESSAPSTTTYLDSHTHKNVSSYLIVLHAPCQSPVSLPPPSACSTSPPGSSRKTCSTIYSIHRNVKSPGEGAERNSIKKVPLPLTMCVGAAAALLPAIMTRDKERAPEHERLQDIESEFPSGDNVLLNAGDHKQWIIVL